MGKRVGRVARIGLRWRLAAWVAAVILACTAVAFVAVYRDTGTQLRRQIDRDLAGDANKIANALAHAHAHSPAQLLRSAHLYIDGRPFSESSTLLFAIVPGAGRSSNNPELLETGSPDSDESAGEQGQENLLARRLSAAGAGYVTLSSPDVGSLRVLKRSIAPPGAPPHGGHVLIGVGELLAPVTGAQQSVARAFVLAGIVALVGALLAAYAIGTRVTRPLRRMAAVAARVDAGDLHPRIEDIDSRGDEVRVLADAFNHMLDRLTHAFAGQRAFVADASHELRTPLTVIRGQLEVLAAQESPPAEEVLRVERLVQDEIGRMTRLVDDLLLLAKAEQAQFLRTERIELGSFVEDLWDGTTLLAARRFELAGVPSGTLLADPDRLAQALRNLLANAIAHTAEEHGLVRLRVEQVGVERVRFIVEDDGPGIPPQERERVFDRFHRIDAARDRATGGTGLGLAIVQAIAVAHGGRVSAGKAPAGGASFELELPRFTPARHSARGSARRAQNLSDSLSP